MVAKSVLIKLLLLTYFQTFLTHETRAGQEPSSSNHETEEQCCFSQEPTEVFYFSTESALPPKARDSKASVQGQRALYYFCPIGFF